MQFQFGMTPSPNEPVPPAGDSATELLRQLLEAQKELVAVQKAMLQAMDGNARWRQLIQRWQSEFPTLSAVAKDALPLLERAYTSMLNSLVEELQEKGSDGLENDFALQEFLDRYGMRLGQLSHLLNLVAPLAEMTAQNEPK